LVITVITVTVGKSFPNSVLADFSFNHFLWQGVSFHN